MSLCVWFEWWRRWSGLSRFAFGFRCFRVFRFGSLVLLFRLVGLGAGFVPGSRRLQLLVGYRIGRCRQIPIPNILRLHRHFRTHYPGTRYTISGFCCPQISDTSFRLQHLADQPALHCYTLLDFNPFLRNNQPSIDLDQTVLPSQTMNSLAYAPNSLALAHSGQATSSYPQVLRAH